jgi:hypothetical protein
MPSDINQAMTLFDGLKALSDASFPKKCATCGQEYATVEEYIRKTGDVSGKSGLKKGYDDDDNPIVELFRNCVCGSTLMDCFNDRRDVSDGGLKKRELYGKLLDLLLAKGLAVDAARSELLKVLKGETSPVLEKLGIHNRIR